MLNLTTSTPAPLDWFTVAPLASAIEPFRRILDDMRFDALYPLGSPTKAVKYPPLLWDAIIVRPKLTVPDTAGAKGFINGKRSLLLKIRGGSEFRYTVYRLFRQGSGIRSGKAHYSCQRLHYLTRS